MISGCETTKSWFGAEGGMRLGGEKEPFCCQTQLQEARFRQCILTNLNNIRRRNEKLPIFTMNRHSTSPHQTEPSLVVAFVFLE